MVWGCFKRHILNNRSTGILNTMPLEYSFIASDVTDTQSPDTEQDAATPRQLSICHSAYPENDPVLSEAENHMGYPIKY